VIKIIYRIIILIGIFLAALSYFSRDIKEVVFDLDNTTVMEDTTFPLVTMKTGENQINLLHGYSSNLAANVLRETVTPLDTSQTFEICINQKEYNIKKLNYEIREFVDNILIESDSVSVFDNVDDEKRAKIKIKKVLETEKEYALKITLITSKSEKMYFYQRIKLYQDSHLKEKIDFVMDFHNAIMNKKTAEDIIKYLEPSANANNTSLSYVNINSSFEIVSWGNLKPKLLTKVIPSVKEIYSDTASIELSYMIESEVAGNIEQYQVTEFYRVRYGTDRMYLLNYERWMESIFDIKLASIAKNELKLGITTNNEVPYVTAEDKTKLAFVRSRELWFYNLEGNGITKVFSFRQENTDYIRDYYDQHDIRILDMDAEGNLDFMVYGYMNRGQYEGKVAIVLYRFIRAENRIEELLYIPVDEPYQTLKENLSELSYINSKDVFYFQLYNSIYSYDFTTRVITEIATGIGKQHLVVLKDLKYAAWQENADPKLAKNICIINLETGVIDKINAKTGYNIRLMDMIDSNIIYGFVDQGDIASMIDGSILAPLSIVEIASVDKKILKSYQKEGYYISGLEVKDNIVELRRVQRVTSNGRIAYSLASPDYIMNQVKAEAELINITTRVSEEALTEYYLTIPGGYVMKELPKETKAVSTVITEDPTVRLQQSDTNQIYYYPYITGGIEGAYDNAAEAIEVAKSGIGVVVNSKKQLIWERGVKVTSRTIRDFEMMDWSQTSTKTIERCLELMLSYQKVNVTNKDLNLDNSTIYEVLRKRSKYTPIRLTGVTLEDVMYYISNNRPVIGLTGLNKAVLIYGYDAFNIMIIDPSTNKKEKIGFHDGAKMFQDAGNIFISYLGQ
jgi:hypothetical protein